jgi:hypothetical protein
MSFAFGGATEFERLGDDDDDDDDTDADDADDAADDDDSDVCNEILSITGDGVVAITTSPNVKIRMIS